MRNYHMVACMKGFQGIFSNAEPSLDNACVPAESAGLISVMGPPRSQKASEGARKGCSSLSWPPLDPWQRIRIPVLSVDSQGL